eukprot:Gb_29133 [translate_table: standard]
MPALFTQISIEPNSVTAKSASFFTSSTLDTSHDIPTTFPSLLQVTGVLSVDVNIPSLISCLSCVTVVCTESRLREAITTRSPERRNSLASAFPRPRVLPVMTTFRGPDLQ